MRGWGFLLIALGFGLVAANGYAWVHPSMVRCQDSVTRSLVLVSFERASITEWDARGHYLGQATDLQIRGDQLWSVDEKINSEELVGELVDDGRVFRWEDGTELPCESLDSAALSAWLRRIARPVRRR